MAAFQDRRKKSRAQSLLIAMVICSVMGICYFAIRGQLVFSIIIGLLPTIIYVLFQSFEYKRIAFYTLFVVNFTIPVLSHYIPDVTMGIVTDALICFNIFIVFSFRLTHKGAKRRISWDIVLAIGIWLFYCILEAFNPRMLAAEAWYKAIRNLALYFICIVILAQTCIESFDDVKEFLGIWSLIIIVAAGKAMYQQFVGFTTGDKYFLYVLDGKVTHLIYYGTRFFSIFSDAANFGGAMGMSMAVYLIKAIHTKQRGWRIYWLIISGLSCYGMFVSGTRSALVVPVGSILAYLFVVRNLKAAIPITALIALMTCLLAFTSIGDSYAPIRRARTIFEAKEDLSYIGRQVNRQKLKEYMSQLPMGNSLGMSGGRGKKYGDNSVLVDIPTDSWFVQLWVETGSIGLAIYLLVMFYIFARCAILIFFQLHDKEIRGVAAGLFAGVLGLFAMSYNCEVFSQIPNGIIVYTCIGLTLSCKWFDEDKKKKEEELAKLAVDYNDKL